MIRLARTTYSDTMSPIVLGDPSAPTSSVVYAKQNVGAFAEGTVRWQQIAGVGAKPAALARRTYRDRLLQVNAHGAAGWGGSGSGYVEQALTRFLVEIPSPGTLEAATYTTQLYAACTPHDLYIEPVRVPSRISSLSNPLYDSGQFTGAWNAIALDLDPLGDFPAEFLTQPTQVVVQPFVGNAAMIFHGAGWITPGAALTGWHLVPGDHGGCETSRVINGKHCLPGYSGALSLGMRGWVESDGAGLYLAPERPTLSGSRLSSDLAWIDTADDGVNTHVKVRCRAYLHQLASPQLLVRLSPDRAGGTCTYSVTATNRRGSVTLATGALADATATELTLALSSLASQPQDGDAWTFAVEFQGTAGAPIFAGCRMVQLGGINLPQSAVIGDSVAPGYAVRVTV